MNGKDAAPRPEGWYWTLGRYGCKWRPNEWNGHEWDTQNRWGKREGEPREIGDAIPPYGQPTELETRLAEYLKLLIERGQELLQHKCGSFEAGVEAMRVKALEICANNSDKSAHFVGWEITNVSISKNIKEP